MAKDTILKVIFGAALLVVMIVGILAVPGLWKSGQQATALPEQTAQQAAIITQGGNPDLTGKTVTMSVFANDYASDAPTSTHAAAPLYLCVSPKSNGANLECDSFASDGGTILDTSSRTSVSSGVTVGNTVQGIAFNGTWYGDLGPVLTIPNQAVNYDVKVYRAATNGGKVTLKDVDQNAVIKGTRNVSVGADEAYTFYSLKIENNNSNRMWDLWGIYFDLVASTNISRFDGSATNRLDGTTFNPASTVDLGRTSEDDKRLVFSKVVRLKEYDSIVLNDLTLIGDGEGCSTDGEDVTMHVVDANYFRSSDFNGLGYGPETDAASPADVGVSDYSQTFTCV